MMAWMTPGLVMVLTPTLLFLYVLCCWRSRQLRERGLTEPLVLEATPARFSKPVRKGSSRSTVTLSPLSWPANGRKALANGW